MRLEARWRREPACASRPLAPRARWRRGPGYPLCRCRCVCCCHCERSEAIPDVDWCDISRRLLRFARNDSISHGCHPRDRYDNVRHLLRSADRQRAQRRPGLRPHGDRLHADFRGAERRQLRAWRGLHARRLRRAHADHLDRPARAGDRAAGARGRCPHRHRPGTPRLQAVPPLPRRGLAEVARHAGGDAAVLARRLDHRARGDDARLRRADADRPASLHAATADRDRPPQHHGRRSRRLRRLGGDAGRAAIHAVPYPHRTFDPGGVELAARRPICRHRHRPPPPSRSAPCWARRPASWSASTAG